MGRKYCSGVVESLRDQSVLLSGKAYIDGEWVERPQIRRIMQAHGARTAFNERKTVTLVLWGKLPAGIIDPVHDQSQKLVFAAHERAIGNHICVVDNNGISNLLRGLPAPCLETHAVDSRTVEVRRSATVLTVADVLGSPVEPHRIPTHESDGLSLDLSALDRGTAAHEALLVALRSHLASKGISVRSHSAIAPRFDAGWETTGEGAAVFVAELKSLTGTTESQQIRLGIGQVLDYVHTIRGMPELGDRRLQPVLVLEHAPAESRWQDLAQSIGIVLSWAPDFPDL